MSLIKRAPATRRWKRITFRIFAALTWTAGIMLAFSYLSPFVDPRDTSIPAFVGLAFLPLLVINLALLLFWVITWRRIAFLPLVVIAAGWPKTQLLFQFNKPGNPSGETLKILSWNTRLFDLYNWTGNKETKMKMFSFLQKEGADILCFQEFYDNPESFPVMDSLLFIQQARNYHVEYSLVMGPQHFGIATLSRHPIINRGVVSFPEISNNTCIFTDIVWNKDTIRVYNLHFQSNMFSEEDYGFFDGTKSGENKKEKPSGMKILGKLKTGFSKRAQQAEIVREHIQKSPYSVIIAGDFNDSPVSFTYRRMTKNFKDAFVEKGTGFGKTYSGKAPSYRIDYILHDEKFRTLDFQTIPENLSDHYPIIAVMEKN
jgi:endonuclease/exonuclease/phosphatase family metal-dependent hydrolase